MSFGVIPIPTTKPSFLAVKIRRAGGGGGSPRRGCSIRTAAMNFAGENFYDLLGISQGGSTAEVKKAFKKMAKKYHPDVSPPELVEEHKKRFIELHKAYETLSDPERREVYDRKLGTGIHCELSSEFNQVLEERLMWKIRWNDQLDGLQKRNMYKDSSENLSWGARMRQQAS